MVYILYHYFFENSQNIKKILRFLYALECLQLNLFFVMTWLETNEDIFNAFDCYDFKFSMISNASSRTSSSVF